MWKTFRQLARIMIQTRGDVAAAIALVALTLAAAGLEVCAIGLVMPFLSVLQDPHGSLAHGSTSKLLAFLHATTPEQAIVATGVLLAAMFVVKNLYLSAFYGWQFRVIETRLRRTLRQLMNNYMRLRYLDFQLRNSAVMIQTVTIEAQGVVTVVVGSTLTLITEGVSAALVVVAVLLLRPDVLLVVLAVTGVTGWLLIRWIYRATGRWGERKLVALGDITKWVQQGLGGFKEARILGAESFFVNAVDHEAATYSRAVRIQRVYAGIPRYLFETLGVLALVAVSLGVVWTGAPLARTLPTLGALAVAAVRLMPSVARSIGSLAEIRHNGPSVGAVYDDLFGASGKPTPEAAATTERLEMREEVSLERVSLRYPSGERDALTDASLTVRRGESIALVGPSGAGKSTLADVLIGVLDPTSGRICVDGTPLDDGNRRAWAHSIGYVPQQVFLCDDTIRRNVALGITDREISDERVRAALAAANLLEFVDGLPTGLDTVVGERGTRLSGGQRQRVGIARALYRKPPVVVFDEATAALDVATEQGVVEAIDRLRGERTIVLIAHRLSTVRNCDRIVVLKDGRITDQGTWDELVARDPTFQNLVRIAQGDSPSESAAAVPMPHAQGSA